MDNEECVFPFIYSEIEFNECTDFQNGGVLWCATQVDGDGYYNGNYGTCSENCPGTIRDKHIQRIWPQFH